jgi:tRNA(Ile2) C34 agmatinyltransferase TiaS
LIGIKKNKMKLIYKKVKVVLPHCPVCKEQLRGNGSMVLPYRCACGILRYNHTTEEYEVEKE